MAKYIIQEGESILYQNSDEFIKFLENLSQSLDENSAGLDNSLENLMREKLRLRALGHDV